VSINPVTGEVDEWQGDDPASGVLVPVHLADLDEDGIAQALPSPYQVERALIESRTRIGRSANVVRDASTKVRESKRDLVLAKALARETARASGTYRTEKDLAAAVELDDTVQQAYDAMHEAIAAYEYARLLRSSLWKDIEVLQSINANMRQEVKGR
jgi:hypothetical protein